VCSVETGLHSPDSGTNVALVDKLNSREVVSHPSNAGNGDKEELKRTLKGASS
jgi:hypothetical protein